MTQDDSTGFAPRFSVIITTFDRPKMLSEAVNSVLAQHVEDLECIVVDDAGKHRVDLPAEPRLRVIRRDQNGGTAAARNTGIRAARGKYVTFLDDDDQYTADRLSVVEPLLERAPVVICWRTGSRRVLEGDVSDIILDDLVPSAGQATIPRDAVPLFDEHLRGAEDVEWWLRLAHSFPVTTVPVSCYVVRSHTGPRQGNGIRNRIDGSRRILDLHRSYFDNHPRALAFRLQRIGLMYMAVDDRRAARSALVRSFRSKPYAKTLWHLGRTFRRTSHSTP